MSNTESTPNLPAGWEIVESVSTNSTCVTQLLRCRDAWAMRFTSPHADDAWTFCANESDARRAYANALEASF